MYLVTGGAGFIGSNLVAALCARGAEVMVVDRLRKGEPGRRNGATWPSTPSPASSTPMRSRISSIPASRSRAVFHLGAISDTTVDRWRPGGADQPDPAADALGLVRQAGRALHLRLLRRDLWRRRAGLRGRCAPGGPGSAAAAQPLWLVEARLRPPRDATARARHAGADRNGRGCASSTSTGPNEYHKGRMAERRRAQIRRDRGRRRRHASSPPTAPASPMAAQQRDFVHVDDAVSRHAVAGSTTRASPACSTWAPARRAASPTSPHAIFAALGRAPRHPTTCRCPRTCAASTSTSPRRTLDRLRAAGYDRPTIPLEEGVARYVRDHLASGDPHR